MKPIFFATDNDPISILTRSRFHLSWAESEDTLPTSGGDNQAKVIGQLAY